MANNPTVTGKNEAFSRAVIDALLKDVGWDVTDGRSVRFEYPLPDGTRADYVLCDRHGRSMAVIEAKRASINPADAAKQGHAYAEQLKVPYVFLSNGREIRFWDYAREAHPREVKTFFSQLDLERRFATNALKRDPLSVAIDNRIVERDYQVECIDTLCREIKLGRRKLLVEMATGSGKTRMAAALIKRMFEANLVTRVLFLVDRIPLALQTEDAFNEHLREYPCYVLRAGRRFQDEKRVTITTLQSMVNIYRDYSAGYFDLVISDECHRSIYGKWSGVLKHFDGIQLGLTATPCVADIDIGDDEDNAFVRDTLRFFEVKKPTFTYKLRDAIRDGWLVPYQIYKAKTVKTAADEGFEVKRAELDWSAMDAETKAEFERLFAGRDTIKVDPASLERRFTIPERNRAIVREFRDVLEKGYADRSGRLRQPLFGKTIVFAVTKRHAETLARMFDEAFADRKPAPEVRYADYVVSGISPDEDTPDGMTRIRRFKREAMPQIMVSVNMLDTGFDMPEVMNLVFARYTRSAILYQQMRGRGSRKAKGKPVYTMFDFVGVTDLHGDDDEFGEGGRVIEQPPSRPPQPRRPLTLDVDDHIDPTTRAWVTVDEDGRLMFASLDEARANGLGAKFEAWLLEHEDLTPEQERLLRLVGEQIRANAGQLNGFGEERFVTPPFSLMGGVMQARRVFGGPERLQAVIESLNRTVFE
ncbi:MAG: DEAD/DEAH box helicase family protein [Betaproteobacteria bacterium]|nr:DEAD/DEAH box helicase family protein [Betaproteobacteria bacterium]